MDDTQLLQKSSNSQLEFNIKHQNIRIVRRFDESVKFKKKYLVIDTQLLYFYRRFGESVKLRKKYLAVVTMTSATCISDAVIGTWLKFLTVW